MFVMNNQAIIHLNFDLVTLIFLKKHMLNSLHFRHSKKIYSKKISLYCHRTLLKWYKKRNDFIQ